MKAEELSPPSILVAVLALMFCAGGALIYSLDYFFPQTMSQQARALVDAGALTLIMAPFIWWLVMRPLKGAETNEVVMGKEAATAAAIITSAERSLMEPRSGEQGLPVDNDQRKAAEERVKRLTSHDGVTGLADRQVMYQCLGEDIAAAKRDTKELALICLSLAKFEQANPALGHHACEHILATVGERIRYQARRSDMVAQMRGDEFAVIMANGASRRNAMDVSARIVSALSKPYYLDGQKQAVQIGSSIGIAIFPTDAQDADNLVKAAYADMENAM